MSSNLSLADLPDLGFVMSDDTRSREICVIGHVISGGAQWATFQFDCRTEARFRTRDAPPGGRSALGIPRRVMRVRGTWRASDCWRDCHAPRALPGAAELSEKVGARPHDMLGDSIKLAGVKLHHILVFDVVGLIHKLSERRIASWRIGIVRRRDAEDLNLLVAHTRTYEFRS